MAGINYTQRWVLRKENAVPHGGLLAALKRWGKGVNGRRGRARGKDGYATRPKTPREMHAMGALVAGDLGRLLR